MSIVFEESSFRRLPVDSERGMVAACQRPAAQAGVEILRQGGNAADAAVATAAALAVTTPASTGLGGDMFALYYDAATKRISALNGSGRAPAALTLALLEQQGIRTELPRFHAHTITVPGACAGWCDLLERFGTRDRATVLSGAIRLASEGFALGPVAARTWAGGAERLLTQSPGGKELLIDGRSPRAGEVFRNPSMAKVLLDIAQGGKEAFYQGWIAERIVETVQSCGGTMTAGDLAGHTSTWEKPISTLYKGVRVYECPPNGQGLTALLVLNILSRFDLPSLGEPLSVRRLHVMIEALRLAFADAGWYVADPDFFDIPLAELLSADYSASRARQIHPERATLDHPHGVPTPRSGTVYFSVVDGWGNACSFVNSNYMAFGTGIVPEGTGFALQNRGLGFSLQPGHPNALAPRKRPYHTIIAGITTREGDDSLHSSFGVMGGFMQPQGHVQVLSGLLDDGLDPQAVLNRPRFCILDGLPGGTVALEDGIPEPVITALSEMGHPVKLTCGFDRSVFGRGQVILRNPADGLLCGGSEPRADGCALGVQP